MKHQPHCSSSQEMLAAELAAWRTEASQMLPVDILCTARLLSRAVELQTQVWILEAELQANAGRAA